MQCQSQIGTPEIKAALAIKSSIRVRNVAWFANRNTIECQEESMEPFEDIECMTIERFYNNYKNSKGNPDHRIVNLGLWSIDLKKRFKFFTLDPNNIEMQRIILRGETYHRFRPERPENSRFVIGSEFDSLTKRSITDEYWGNWLGYTWASEYNGGRMNNPSLNQIERGLVAEALV